MFVRILIIFFLVIVIPINLFSISREPWYKKRIKLLADVPCNNTIFDGAPLEYSKIYLSVYADNPIYIVIFNGSRFIRENILAHRRVVFNFINKDGFNIEVCRKGFAVLRKYQEQQARIAANEEIPPEELVPAPEAEDVGEIIVTLDSN